MTTQEILTRVNDLCKLIDAQPVGATLADYSHALRDDLAAQLRAEIARQGGTGNAVKTIERMLKPMRGSRDALAYPWTDAEGRQCVCDGFRAYRLRKPLPLAERPASAGMAIDLAQIYPRSTADYASIPMPEYSAVKSFIATFQAENGRKATPLWHFGKRMPTVDARYLLDLITVFPSAAEIKYNPAPSGMYSPLVLECETGDALLLPVRVTGKDNGWSKDDIAEYNAAVTLRNTFMHSSKYIADENIREIDFDDFAALELLPA